MKDLMEEYIKIKKLKTELVNLTNKYSMEQRDLEFKIKTAEDSLDKKLQKLSIEECGKRPGGHTFVNNSGTSIRTGRDEQSEICTNCGCEKEI